MKTKIINKFISQFVIVVAFCSTVVSPLYAAVTVYTDRAAWEAASIAFHGYPYSEDFEMATPGGLVTGQNFSGNAAMLVFIPGDPGFNSFDNLLTLDPFANALSPDGSTYYLGETTGGVASPYINFALAPANSLIYAFGGDWVLGTASTDNLTIPVRSTTITISDYLTTDSGFLGFTSDAPVSLITLGTQAGTGTAYFGLDNIQAGVVPSPIPASVWLFGSGLLGLIGVARRKVRV